MSSYLKLISHPCVFADAILTGQKPKVASRATRARDRQKRDQVIEMIPEIPDTQFQLVLKQTLIDSHICTFALFWLKIGIPEPLEEEIVQRGSLEPRPIARANFVPVSLCR